MKQKFSDDEINAIILKHLKGQSINSICKEYEISIATFYRWKNKHFSVTEDVLRLLQKLEIENNHLKLMYAEEKLFSRLNH